MHLHPSNENAYDAKIRALHSHDADAADEGAYCVTSYKIMPIILHTSLIIDNSNEIFYNGSTYRGKGPFLNELLLSSIHEVFENHFSMPLKPCPSVPAEEGYAAAIPFSDAEGEKEALIWLQRPLLEKIALLLLGEESPDGATLADLAAEVANFVVGHAKMEASDKNIAFTMGTPHFEGVLSSDSLSEGVSFCDTDEGSMVLRIKDANVR